MNISAVDFLKQEADEVAERETVEGEETLTDQDEEEMVKEALMPRAGDMNVNDLVADLRRLVGPGKEIESGSPVLVMDSDTGEYYDLKSVQREGTDLNDVLVLRVKRNDQAPEEIAAYHGDAMAVQLAEAEKAEKDVAETENEIMGILEGEVEPENERDMSDVERQMEECGRIEDDVDEDDDMLSESVIRRAAQLSRELW
jgi:hypothetical protein